jgi:CubicO group peptidase (beta-lactamase class C family)
LVAFNQRTWRRVGLLAGSAARARSAQAGAHDAFAETAAFALEHQPGEHWAYNTPVYRMLLRVLELATGESINQFTQRQLATPLGMNYSGWDCPPAPQGKTNCNWYRSCLRDMARFGLLILRNGKWEQPQLVSAHYVKESTSSSQKLNAAYGYFGGSTARLRSGCLPVSPRKACSGRIARRMRLARWARRTRRFTSRRVLIWWWRGTAARRVGHVIWAKRAAGAVLLLTNC